MLLEFAVLISEHMCLLANYTPSIPFQQQVLLLFALKTNEHNGFEVFHLTYFKKIIRVFLIVLWNV